MGGIYEMKKPARINSFSVTLTLIVATLAYAGYFFIPVWWPVFQVTGIMRGICNDAYHTFENEKLMEKLLKETKRTGLYLTSDNFVLERVPYTEEDYQAQNIDYSKRPAYERRGKLCRLTLTYTSKARWPFLEKVTDIPWNRSIETDLSIIKW